jgi:hypothetical protein
MEIQPGRPYLTPADSVANDALMNVGTKPADRTRLKELRRRKMNLKKEGETDGKDYDTRRARQT